MFPLITAPGVAVHAAVVGTHYEPFAAGFESACDGHTAVKGRKGDAGANVVLEKGLNPLDFIFVVGFYFDGPEAWEGGVRCRKNLAAVFIIEGLPYKLVGADGGGGGHLDEMDGKGWVEQRRWSDLIRELCLHKSIGGAGNQGGMGFLCKPHSIMAKIS